MEEAPKDDRAGTRPEAPAEPAEPPVAVEDCSMVRTLALVGERWALLVMREAFYGVRRFEDMGRHLGVARNVLSDRLGALVEHGLLERVPYKVPGRRTRHEYHLTRKGADLLPALLALMQWGDRHLPHQDGPPLRLFHEGCGREVRVGMVCADGHEVQSVRELRAVAWPERRERA